jgi:hypothetical protein
MKGLGNSRALFLWKNKLNVPELIRMFSASESVPIDIESEVLAAIRAAGVVDEIYLWSVDIDDSRLRGFVAHWEVWDYEKYEITRQVVDIYVSNHLEPDWIRLVTCKELLHVLDPEYCRVATEEDVQKLVSKIALPAELQDPIKDGLGANTDRIAIYEALAVLFPMAVRDLLLESYKAGKISRAEIAKLVDLPVRYIGMVMTDEWATIHEILVAGLEAED